MNAIALTIDLVVPNDCYYPESLNVDQISFSESPNSLSMLTGNGLKEPSSAIDYSINETYQGIEANIDAVAKVMGF